MHEIRSWTLFRSLLSRMPTKTVAHVPVEDDKAVIRNTNKTLTSCLASNGRWNVSHFFLAPGSWIPATVPLLWKNADNIWLTSKITLSWQHVSFSENSYYEQDILNSLCECESSDLLPGNVSLKKATQYSILPSTAVSKFETCFISTVQFCWSDK